MNEQWQHWVVFGVVGLTVVVFVWRAVRRRRAGPGAGCGVGCGCGRSEVKRNEVIEKVVRQQMKD